MVSGGVFCTIVLAAVLATGIIAGSVPAEAIIIIVLRRLVVVVAVGTVGFGCLLLRAIIYAASYGFVPIALGSITNVGVLIVLGIEFSCWVRFFTLGKLLTVPDWKLTRY